MEDIEKTKKQKKILIITLTVLALITIVLTIVSKSIGPNNKTLKGQDYIIEKETEYKDKGLLPRINLNGKEIDEINATIIEKYYSIAHTEYDTFNYEYFVYKDILSLHIIVTYTDDSEYGNMENLTYNIDVENTKVLSNDEVIDKLGLKKENINKKIEDRLEKWYNSDSLKEQLSYEEYKKKLDFDKSKNSLFIRDNKLYYYIPIYVTQDLLSYEGNIYEVELEKLKN